jgi:hypothetical protein
MLLVKVSKFTRANANQAFTSTMQASGTHFDFAYVWM